MEKALLSTCPTSYGSRNRSLLQPQPNIKHRNVQHHIGKDLLGSDWNTVEGLNNVCSNVLNIHSHFCLVRHMVISASLASPKQGRANSASPYLPTFVERAQGSCRVAKLGLFLEPCLTECLEDCVLIPAKFYHDAKWLLPTNIQ